MMNQPHHLAVCSWSLRPASADDLASQVQSTGLRKIQLAIDPIRTNQPGWSIEQTQHALASAGIQIVSGMMAPAGENYDTLDTIRESGGLRPSNTWPENQQSAIDNAAIAKHLGIKLITLHAGCIPSESDSPLRREMLHRLRTVCQAFATQNINVAFETGQDPPSVMLDLLEHLADLDVGLNFDPANMILYGSAEPLAAIKLLARRVKQIHLKDAITSPTPGLTWGAEVQAGSGNVNWADFFDYVKHNLPGITIVIEREGGEQRIDDVKAGAQLAAQHLEIAP